MSRLRLATWNIHGGVGLDRRFDPERIARVIGELDVQLVALQEFHSRDGFALREHLERATGWTAVVAPTFVKHGGDFGNAVLSALPVESAAVHDLAVAGREPRNAIDVTVAAGSTRVRVVATHLGLRAGERARQIDRVCGLIGARERCATVVLGDFNEWWRSGGSMRAIDRVLTPVRAIATFPSPRALLALDRAWVSSAVVRVETQVHRSRLARVASDHLPLIVAIDIDDGG